MKKNLVRYIDKFKNKKICVIGDIMADVFIWGEVNRISPEAPVPVILVNKETCVPGGAANTANNIISLGGNVSLVGVLGDDEFGRILLKQFCDKKINTSGVLVNKKIATIQKTRIIAARQQVVRVDRENGNSLSLSEEEKIINFIEKNIKEWDGLVFSDYNKGFFNKKIFEHIIKLANKFNKPLFGDVKPCNAKYCKNIFLLAPNFKEAKEISGKDVINDVCKAIRKKLNCNVLVTQGADGMTLCTDKKMEHFSTVARNVFDVVGAGDTVMASAILSFVSGATIEDAAVVANHAAGIVVGKIGTSVVFPEELRDVL